MPNTATLDKVILAFLSFTGRSHLAVSAETRIGFSEADDGDNGVRRFLAILGQHTNVDVTELPPPP